MNGRDAPNSDAAGQGGRVRVARRNDRGFPTGVEPAPGDSMDPEFCRKAAEGIRYPFRCPVPAGGAGRETDTVPAEPGYSPYLPLHTRRGSGVHDTRPGAGRWVRNTVDVALRPRREQPGPGTALLPRPGAGYPSSRDPSPVAEGPGSGRSHGKGAPRSAPPVGRPYRGGDDGRFRTKFDERPADPAVGAANTVAWAVARFGKEGTRS